MKKALLFTFVLCFNYVSFSQEIEAETVNPQDSATITQDLIAEETDSAVVEKINKPILEKFKIGKWEYTVYESEDVVEEDGDEFDVISFEIIGDNNDTNVNHVKKLDREGLMKTGIYSYSNKLHFLEYITEGKSFSITYRVYAPDKDGKLFLQKTDKGLKRKPTEMP